MSSSAWLEGWLLRFLSISYKTFSVFLIWNLNYQCRYKCLLHQTNHSLQLPNPSLFFMVIKKFILPYYDSMKQICSWFECLFISKVDFCYFSLLCNELLQTFDEFISKLKICLIPNYPNQLNMNYPRKTKCKYQNAKFLFCPFFFLPVFFWYINGLV